MTPFHRRQITRRLPASCRAERFMPQLSFADHFSRRQRDAAFHATHYFDILDYFDAR